MDSGVNAFWVPPGDFVDPPTLIRQAWEEVRKRQGRELTQQELADNAAMVVMCMMARTYTEVEHYNHIKKAMAAAMVVMGAPADSFPLMVGTKHD